MIAIRRVFCQLILPSVVVALCSTSLTFAMAGTSQVAVDGKPAHVSPSWPQGTGDLVNDPMRTKGWSPWFSEWPNDVNHYAFKVKSTEDLNALIAKFAAIKADSLEIHLTPLAEPRSLGFVSQLPEGNGIPVLFSIGDQAVIDRWFKQVEKPFGKMELATAPKAMVPTLTLFVQNPLVKLDDLVIPEGITLLADNATITPDKKGIELLNQDPDGVSVSPSEKIQWFLDSREDAKGE